MTQVLHNPNCDSDHCTSSTGEVRRLPTGRDGAVIVCQACYRYEMRWRRERNAELGFKHKLELPPWESLEVYQSE